MTRSAPACPDRSPPRRRPVGQTLAELGIVMPFLMFLLLGIVQVGYLIYQQYDAIHLAREAANLIARDGDMDQAANAIEKAQLTRNFNSDVKLVLSVLQLGPTGGQNDGVPIIMNRYIPPGSFTGTSVLGDPSPDKYNSPASNPPDPTYTAKSPDRDKDLQAKLPLPNNLTIGPNQSVYVAEIFIRRRDILPFSRTPGPLYAAAYF